ncbi:zeatin O-glucosyltransferase-like [Capsicum annuum]|uniref:zeatin O-glucosyltransferase-like n=1 Tax=Capsicum annuum TaxID=4072 RepID=UPI001FB07FC5|nr:zeatin O-glucosyltransferase-like [Capsicum annuum]
MATTNSSDNEVIVAIVPFPDYSHLNQLFILARLVASHNIPVHFLCLADQNQDLKLHVQGGLGASNIHFEDLMRPSDDDNAAGHDPILMFLKKLREPIQKTCIELSTNAKRLVIIHEFIMTELIWNAHTFPNVKSYIFHAGSAFNRYYRLQQSIPDIVDDDDHVKLVEQMHDELPLLEPDGKLMVRMEHELKFYSGEVINSCKEVEGKYIDLLANAKGKPFCSFGPFHMLLESHESISSSSSNMIRNECLEFLDMQDVNSVIFISFGSTTTLSQEQINELALGLEQSNYGFIWVLRKRNNVEKLREKDGKIELPEGFEERVKGRGMVVNWAPQLEILRHSSTGGFLSHCGWNSCLESISMGVPLATWPISYDQPYNAMYVTNVLKIGISIKSCAHREELVTASTIEKAVKTLMGTTEGEEMRQRAVELSNKIKSSVSHGGHACMEMESFISNIIK